MGLRLGRMTLVIVGVGVLVGLAYGAMRAKSYFIGQYFATMAAEKPTISAEPAASAQWEQTVPAIGTLRAIRGTDVSPMVEGQVVQINFGSGDTVIAGAPLVVLDSDIEASNVASAEASLALAKITIRRTSVLTRSAAASQSSLDQAVADVKTKQAALDQANAALAKRTIYAPFTGTLGIRHVDLGQHLTPGASITTLEDMSTMLLDFTVPQNKLQLLTIGQTVRIKTDAFPDRTFEGAISAIDAKIDASSGLVAIEAKFPNPGNVLRPGLFANVDLLKPQKITVVTVPISAVDYTLHGDSVFLVTTTQKDGKTVNTVERAAVTTGEKQGDRVAILDGVKVGDQVVTAGQLKLSNGMEVEVAPSSLTPPAKLSPY